jgi:prepilin-type N-terminal cleavage/methylation domain-containing protein/prepilin-type processing-associated H-X9-DG protein
MPAKVIGNRQSQPWPRFPAGRGGFSLIELLVVIAIIAILASLLLPSLSRSKAMAQSAACQNNLRQLQICWHLYADDNDGALPPNNYVYFGPTESPLELFDSWCKGNARLDLTTTNIEQGKLFPYNRSVGIYRCPADKSTVELPGGQRSAQLRTRSYTMSGAINCDTTKDIVPDYRKYGEMIRPSPTETFVFIDTHEEAILDAHFGVMPPFRPSEWGDLPADRHLRGANLSFADGHVEHWRWLAPKKFRAWGQQADGELDLRDLRRLRQCIRQEKASLQPAGN